MNAFLISDENKKHTHFASGVEKGLLSEEVRYSTSRRETSVELLKRVYGPIRLIPPGTASLPVQGEHANSNQNIFVLQTAAQFSNLVGELV